MLYINTHHRRTRALGARTGWVEGRAQLSCSTKAGISALSCSTPQHPRDNQALGGGFPGFQALASHSVSKGATVSE